MDRIVKENQKNENKPIPTKDKNPPKTGKNTFERVMTSFKERLNELER